MHSGRVRATPQIQPCKTPLPKRFYTRVFINMVENAVRRPKSSCNVDIVTVGRSSLFLCDVQMPRCVLVQSHRSHGLVPALTPEEMLNFR